VAADQAALAGGALRRAGAAAVDAGLVAVLLSVGAHGHRQIAGGEVVRSTDGGEIADAAVELRRRAAGVPTGAVGRAVVAAGARVRRIVGAGERAVVRR